MRDIVRVLTSVEKALVLFGCTCITEVHDVYMYMYTYVALGLYEYAKSALYMKG